mmetsp:Transcript_26258/g.25430  ORF Transcript_26258/g.25430 Transcript_26258/m.25430 type:complete len:85 (+) Transcript_26258:867-1121(+)
MREYLIPNANLAKPIVHLFSSEYEVSKYRKVLQAKSLCPEYKGRIRDVILETMDEYEKLNEYSLDTINGEKFIKPPTHLQQDQI